MTTFLGLSRATLQWVTVWGPACYLSVLAVTILYLHPHPLPPFWPALAIVLTLSAVGTFAFSQFVFTHVQRQEQEILRGTRELAEANEAGPSTRTNAAAAATAPAGPGPWPRRSRAWSRSSRRPWGSSPRCGTTQDEWPRSWSRRTWPGPC